MFLLFNISCFFREGLEKMEREKQRQLERQAPTSESETPEIKVKQVSSKTLTTTVNLLNMSNVVSREVRLWAALDSISSCASCNKRNESGCESAHLTEMSVY